ncbi:hypothetical protein OSB04_007809 [Centaurea solstitialis]|uniref:Pentatricopeptide repeat-containing protein n=1 Tax=Centaurea solstitialis TaxID=347529 RepID=A0AA38TKL2_9ASTR|nr:hypothetical protein OSB04_007809 [Centaurea solstitialis]
MYSKSGEIVNVRWVFDEKKKKNVFSWTSLIVGYGKHGYGGDSIALYNEMLDSGLETNDVTFLSLLFWCSHGGLTEEGNRYFCNMGEVLGECSVYGNVIVGKVAAKRLFDLNLENSMNYVVMVSIYAAGVTSQFRIYLI